jgi:Flp pilus assembly protein TadD
MKGALLWVWLAAGLAAAQGSASLLEQADSAFRQGDLETAGSLARRVLARDPSAAHAHLILGVIAAQRRDWEASSRHFQTVVKLQPANPFGYFYLGQAKLYQRQWEAAIQLFSKALEHKYPEVERLLVELALAQNEAGRPKQALATLSKMTPPAQGPAAAQYHAVTAFAMSNLGQGAGAIEAIRKAVHLDDTNPHSWEFLIGTLLNSDQAPQALAEAIRAQSRFPDHADIQYLFALASYHVVESPLGGVALRNLREADPDSPRVDLAEGLWQRKLGKNEEATKAFERAAARGATDAHLLLGIVHKDNGDYAAAEREYREAERLNPRNGQALLELGKLLLAKGALQEARARLEAALDFMADAPSVHYQLGLLYNRLGDKEKSQQHLKLAKQR